jgi:HAD superfamily hydrolase (TIGR01459 family)
MQSLDRLPDRHRLILCDIWGCVHDGVHIFPEAARLLALWREQGRIVLLITNAPRPAAAVEMQLDRMGLNRATYDAVITSGDTGLAALRAAGRDRVGFIGTASDRVVLEATGLDLLEGSEGDDVVCTGLRDGSSDATDEEGALRAMLARSARLHCFNPDRLVHRGGVAEPCAGAIAELYEAMGGRVAWYGKPYPPIYARALEVAAELAGRAFGASQTVAVGDSLATDFTGAAKAGFDFVFVTHGIEGSKVAAIGAEQLLAEFAADQGIDLPAPIAVVSRLG